jgi:hypothetical protein
MNPFASWRARRSLAGSVLALLLAGAGALADETAWVFPPPQPLRVNLVQGLWHEHYRLPAGLARAGGALVCESWDSGGCGSGWPGPGDQGGDWVWYFDGAPAALRRQHVVVVANVNARSFRGAQQSLVDYVHAGGSVFFLGGRWAFGKAYRESPLAGICPVEFPGDGRWDGSDLQFRPQGVPLAPGADTIGAGFAGLSWDRQPQLYWYHTVRPKPGSLTLLTAEGNPALVVGTAGKGRVAVFAGTVMGAPADGQLPAWAWDGWPEIVAATIRWLAEAPGMAPHEPDDAMRAAFRAAALSGELDLDEPGAGAGSAPGGESVPAGAALLALADATHTAVSVGFLLQSVVSLSGDIAPEFVQTFDRTAFPAVTAEHAAPARHLLESGCAYKTALGLRILGASRTADAAATLAAFHASGKPAPRQAGEGLDTADLRMREGLVDAGEEQRRETAIRLAALAGLGHLGSAEAGAALAQARPRHAAGRLDPKAYEDRLAPANLLHQQAAVSALRCGDPAVAGEVVELLLENVYLIARARTEANKPKDRLARVHEAIGWELAWQQDLYRQLQAAPESVLPALAQALAAAADRRVTLIALAAFAGRDLPEDARAALRQSPHEPLRLLAESGRVP